MKKIFSLLAVVSIVLATNSCQKDNLFNNDVESLVFTASIDNGLETKTTITSERKVNWVEGDVISINGVEFSATPKEDATKADFTKVSGDDPTGSYKAIFPSSLYVTDHFELPATQTYTAGEFNAPMYAESETNSLSFKNICGVLKISVPGTMTVKSISVSSDLVMNGTFTIVDDIAKMSKTSGLAEADKAVTLDCGDGVAGTDFYVAIPAGTYTGKNLKVTVTDSKNKEHMMATSPSAKITVEANTMYAFNFSPCIDESIINPNEYLIYHPNEYEEWDTGRENHYGYCSYAKAPSGATWEFKFKLASSQNGAVLYSSNYAKDDYQSLCFSSTNFYCYSGKDGETSFLIKFEDLSKPIKWTDVITLRLSNKLNIINDIEIGEDFDGFYGGDLFCMYYGERDEGWYSSRKGLPDGTRIYYVKVWDSNGKLIYIGHPGKESQFGDWAWHSVTPDGEKYEYAGTYIPGGVSIVSYGHGID